MVRLNDNGSTDISFHRSAGGNDVARAVDIDSQNRIVVGGFTNLGANPDNFCIMRFTSAGAFDPGFNGGNSHIIDFGFDDEIRAIKVVAGDKIVAAGFDDGGSSNFALVRLNENGTLDATFNDLPAPSLSNGDGKLSFNLGGAEFATGLAVRPNGKLVVGGFTSAGGGTANNVAVARITSSGTLDTSFTASGFRIYDLGGNDEAHGLVVDNVGRVVLAGFVSGTAPGATNDFAVVRVGAPVVAQLVSVPQGTSSVLMVQVRYADTGVLKRQFLSPFQAPTYTNIVVAVVDTNSDGVTDKVRVSARLGSQLVAQLFTE